MDNIKVLFDEKNLQDRIKEIAKKIDNEYDGEEIIVVSVLKGAVIFTVDLVKNMKTPLELEFVQISSYKGTESTGNIIVKKDLEKDIEGKNILIVEDIVDSGRSLKYLKEYFLSKNPKSVKIVVLLDKKERREVNINVDYVGYEIPNKFVVGYGLDIDEKLRNLPYIGYIED